MKRKLFLLLCALLGMLTSVQEVKADVVPTASTPSAGNNYYLYNPVTGKFLFKSSTSDADGNYPYVQLKGDAWTLESSDKGGYYKLRLKGNETAYFWGKYWMFIEGNYSKYPDENYFQIQKVENTDNDYKLHSFAWDGTANSYVYINAENGWRVAGNSQDQGSLDTKYTIWQFVTEADYATYISKKYGDDVSSKVTNTTFESNKSGWTADPGFTNNQINNNQYGAFTGYFWENWRSNDSGGGSANKMYQTISSIENGVYTLVMAAFVNYLDGEHQYVFANDDKTYLTTTTPTYYEVQTFVKNNSLSIGLEQTSATAGWMGIDNVHLYYLGNDISYYSPATFTSGSSATKDKWYAFTVPSGGRYKISSNEQVTLKYSQDETKDADANDLSTVAITQGGSNCVTLTAGTFYFKGNANASLNITACTYTLGDATTSITNDSYYNTGTLSSFTVTFPDATTDDTNASLAVIGSPVATLYKNGSSVATSSTLTSSDGTLTATFSDVALTADATDYSISIPAGSFGYAGHVTNSAISVNFNTPVVFDGMYYLYDATNKLFLGRGAEYGTRAVVDKYGVAFTWSNTTKLITFVDWDDRSLFFNKSNHADCWVYTDGAEGKGNDRLMAFTDAGDGKVYLQDAAKAVWIKHDNSVLNVPVTSASTATQWTIMTKAEHDAIVNAYPTDNKDNVIDAAGITTSLSFDDYLTTHCEAAVDKTDLIGTAKFSGVRGSWTYASVRTTQADNKTTRNPAYGTNFAEVFEITGTHSQTIEKASLPAGIYKVTVDGFERHASYEITTTLGEAGHNLVASYLSVNGEQVRLADWYDVHAAAKKASPSVADSYPDNTTEAVACFTAKYATSELYIYLDGNTDLEIKVCKPSFIPGNWAIFNNFTLTYYADKVAANKKTIADNKGDITSLVSDNDFTSSATGWSGGTRVTGLARSWRNGSDKNPFYEVNATHGITDGKGKITYTVSNMPAGTYKVVAASRAYEGGVIQPEIAGTTGVSLTGVGDARNVNSTTEINMNGVEMPYSTLGGFTDNGNGHNWKWITATGTLASAGDLVINFNCTGTSWMPIDDVHLYCTELDGVEYTQTLSTIDDNTEVDNTGNRSVVTCDLAMSNPNAIISSSAAINGAAGAINNNLVSGTIANMVLYDGYDFTAPVGSYAATAAKLYRSIAVNKWVSLILPFVPTTEFSDKKAPSGLSEGTLSFADATPANDAPMMVRNTSEISEIVGARADGTTGNLKAGEGAPMVGVYEAGGFVPVSVDGATRYVVSGNQLHKVTSEVNIKPFRAYFELIDSKSPARLVISFDGEDPTGINAVEATETEAGTLKDGKYLIDGKIVIVKNGVKYDANGKKLN